MSLPGTINETEMRRLLEAQEKRLTVKFRGMLEDQNAMILKGMGEMLDERVGVKRVDEHSEESKKIDMDVEEESSTQEYLKAAKRGMAAAAFGVFMEYDPPTFHGIPQLESVEEWVRDTRRALNKSQCSKEHKVEVAAARLRARALRWWKSLEEDVGREILYGMVDWDKFVEMIKGEFSTKQQARQLEENLGRKNKGSKTKQSDHGKRGRRFLKGGTSNHGKGNRTSLNLKQSLVKLRSCSKPLMRLILIKVMP